VPKIQDDDVTNQNVSNSIWKNIKKEANHKAGNNYPPSKRRHKIPGRHLGSKTQFYQTYKYIVGKSENTTKQDIDTSK